MVRVALTVAVCPSPSLKVMVVKPGVEPAVMVKDVPLVGATLAINVLALLALKVPENPASLTDNVADWPAAVNDSDDGEATIDGCGVDVGAIVGIDVGFVVGAVVGVDVGVVVGPIVGVDVGGVVGVTDGAGVAGVTVGTGIAGVTVGAGVGLIGADGVGVAVRTGAGAPTMAAPGLGELFEPPPHAWTAMAAKQHDDAAKTHCLIFTSKVL